MATTLQSWRKRNQLTQVDAANLLGVSQTYWSLLEKGARRTTPALRQRLQAAHRRAPDDTEAERIRAGLSALGYPAFAHTKPARSKPSPDSFLLSILAQPDVDARVVDALPWLVRNHAAQMDLPWLVRQAKLQNLQNRMGFIFREAAVDTVAGAIEELDRARLLQEATLCWDAMPAATRNWMRLNRSPSAAHWNILTRLRSDDDDHAT